MKYTMTDADTLARMADLGRWKARWYHGAHRTVLSIANQFGKQPQYVADVLAVTSPRVAVTRNIRATRFYFQCGALPTDLIRTTHLALDHYERTGEIRGPKTSRFAKCLMLDEEPVVLDVWMSKALKVPQSWFGSKSGYAAGEEQIRRAASLCGLPPAQTQAAIWAYAVGADKRNAPLFEDIG